MLKHPKVVAARKALDQAATDLEYGRVGQSAVESAAIDLAIALLDASNPVGASSCIEDLYSARDILAASWGAP